MCDPILERPNGQNKDRINLCINGSVQIDLPNQGWLRGGLKVRTRGRPARYERSATGL
jgi:hypothetical protein